jgi:hypothetical protein
MMTFLNPPLAFEGRGTMRSMVEGRERSEPVPTALRAAPPPHFVRSPSPANAGEDF